MVSKYNEVSVKIRVKREVEELVRKVGEKYDLTSDAVRNLAILLGLRDLTLVMRIDPEHDQLEKLYYTLLSEVKKYLEET